VWLHCRQMMGRAAAGLVGCFPKRSSSNNSRSAAGYCGSSICSLGGTGLFSSCTCGMTGRHKGVAQGVWQLG